MLLNKRFWANGFRASSGLLADPQCDLCDNLLQQCLDRVVSRTHFGVSNFAGGDVAGCVHRFCFVARPVLPRNGFLGLVVKSLKSFRGSAGLARKRLQLGIMFTHGGGPWKAFIRQQLRGKKGLKVNPLLMRRLSRQYWALTAAEEALLVKQGSIMTEAYREVGPQSRTVPRTSDGLGLIVASASFDIGRPLTDQLEALKGRLAAQRRAAREESDKVAAALVTWGDEHDGAQFNELAGPALPLCKPMPGGVASTGYCAVPSKVLVERCLAGLSPSDRCRLLHHWDQLHTIYTPTEAPPIGNVAKGYKHLSLCHLAGFCLHTLSGERVAKFECAFMKVMAAVFPAKTVYRKALTAGACIAKVYSGRTAMYLHISYTVLLRIGWKFSLTNLSSCWDDGRLQHTGEPWLLTWQMFRNFDFQLPHWVEIFTIDDFGYGSLDKFKPGAFRVAPFVPPRKFWEGLVVAADVDGDGGAAGHEHGQIDDALQVVAHMRPREEDGVEEGVAENEGEDDEGDLGCDLEEALAQEIERAFADAAEADGVVDAESADLGAPFRGGGDDDGAAAGDDAGPDHEQPHEPAAASADPPRAAPPPPLPPPCARVARRGRPRLGDSSLSHSWLRRAGHDTCCRDPEPVLGRTLRLRTRAM